MKKLFKGINVPGTIIITIFCAILINIFKQPVNDVLQNFSGNLFTFFIDLFYRFAATTSSGSFIAFSVYLSFFAITFKFLCDLFVDLLSFRKQYNSMTSYDLKRANENLLLNEKEISHINSDISKVKEYNKNTKRLNFFTIILIILLIILSFVFIIYEYMPVRLKNTFDNNIIKITPYVETHDIEMLKSDWVRMTSREDYINIKEQIDTIIEKNNLG